jgi:hypothetical protein
MEEATKTAYVSPPHGQLDITLIRDANPRVTISLDLGIPNFTVFSMNLPMAEGQPNAMSELIAESVHVLLDEVATFMMVMEYDEQVIVELYATVLATFKSMSTEADSAKEQDVTGQDPTVSIYEGTFDIPMTFINETQKRVVTAATKIVRQPKVRHLELTYSPKEKTKPSDTARVIRQYRSRSIKQQPKPMYVIVYDQIGRATGVIPVGPGKNFKNELLKRLPKKGSIDFTAPMSFISEQEMKGAPLNGIPRAISVGGMTYQPEAMSGGDMALYHGPQDYIVKFPDGRSAIFPGRPTFRKMRLLNFPVPRNRYKWTMIPEESLAVPKFDGKQEEAAQTEAPTEAPQEEIKEAAEPQQQPQENTQQKEMITPDQVMRRSGGKDKFRGMEQIYLKPTKTYDDLVPLDKLQKRLVSDKLSGQPIFQGLMLIDRIGHYGTFEGKQVLVIPQYYIRRHGVQNADGTWTVYHLRSDGRMQRVFGKVEPDKFIDAKPVESSIGNKEGV